MSSILVTGGMGAIGFHLCQALAERGDEVYIADNYSRSERDVDVEELIKKTNVHEININLCNKGEYIKLPENVDFIYHFAAMNGTQNFYERPFDVLVNSTQPTIELLTHYAGCKSLKRFIYAGSSEAYASSVTLFDWEVPTKENVPLGIADPTNVRWSYGGSKMHGELAVVAAGAQFDMPFTVIRFHNVYGPRMGDKHIIPDFLDRAKKGVYELYGYEDTRSFIYVADAVEATILCAETEDTANEIVNVGGLPEITMLDLGKKMMEQLGIESEIACHPSPAGSVRRRAPDLSKLKKLTNFEQMVSLDDGLNRTINFHINEG